MSSITQRRKNDPSGAAMENEGEDTKKKEQHVAKYVGIPQDIFAWSVGIAFIVSLMVAMMGFGHLRGWDAESGFTHNTSETSAERFLTEPTGEECGDEDIAGRCGNTASGRWYYWQIPPDEITAWTRAFVWLCYISHQLFIWGTIYVAQRLRARNQNSGLKYSNTMTRYQWVPLIGNMGFHLLHLAQTHWTYDAMAQEVSEASSQSSVIMIMVLVLLMEYRDRGLFFGWPTSKHKGKVSRALRLQQGPVNLVRKYHGYAFAWGAIYTFWYHPMENTWGHVLGFIHTWMLMLQGSLMFTNIHLNRYWRLTLEFWVTIHSTVVAVQTGGPSLQLWPMFCFGFLWLFLMTQLFGLQFWKKLPFWTKPIPFFIYMAIMIGLYGFYFVDSEGRYWIRLNELVRIPSIEYSAFIFSWFCLWSFLKIEEFVKRRYSIDSSEPVSEIAEVAYVFLSLTIYALLVATSYLIQELDWKIDLIALMVVLVILFILLVTIQIMFMKQVMRPVRNRKVVPSPDNTNNSKVELTVTENGTKDNRGMSEDE